MTVLHMETDNTVGRHISFLYDLNRTECFLHSPIFRLLTPPSVYRSPGSVTDRLFTRQEEGIVNTGPYRTAQNTLAMIHIIPHLVQQRSPHRTKSRIGRQFQAVVSIQVAELVECDGAFAIAVFIRSGRPGIMMIGYFQFAVIGIRSPLAEDARTCRVHLLHDFSRLFEIFGILQRFISQRPHDNGRMAAVQVHHFDMLVHQYGIMHLFRYIRVMCPAERSFHFYQHSQFIAGFQ